MSLLVVTILYTISVHTATDKYKMISFKEFLAESQNYPLYHGLAVYSLDRVIDSDKLKTGGYNDSHYIHKQLTGKYTISLTRSKSFAEYWRLS